MLLVCLVLYLGWTLRVWMTIHPVVQYLFQLVRAVLDLQWSRNPSPQSAERVLQFVNVLTEAARDQDCDEQIKRYVATLYGP